MINKVKLLNMPPPASEIPSQRPELPVEVYRARLERLRGRMKEVGLDQVIIYADREHAANFAYLAGFGPRFEEALLIIGLSGTPQAVLGTENIDMVKYTAAELEGIHYPTFSLMGQPRDDVKSLQEILQAAGLKRGMNVGTVGWKYYDEKDGCPVGSFEIPHYIVETIFEIVGETSSGSSSKDEDSRVRNATDIFMSPYDGLRVVLEPEQVIVFEYAACLVAHSMLALMDYVDVGKTELEIAGQLQSRGIPLSCHPMLSVGEKARFGLTSPSNRQAERGDFMTTAYGIEGALACRAAYIARDENDLATDTQDWLEQMAIPYFATAVTWFQTIRIGIEGGVIWDMAITHLPKAKFGWKLNPGHFIAADEWVSTPFMPGSDVKLQSGNYIQYDLIIAPDPPYFGADLEDGIVLADEGLRASIQAKSPETWARFERRRQYIRDVLGIELGDEVLPMSDIFGYYRPFLLSKGNAFAIR
ncbi:MAG: hypothetical protein GX998_09720 [Firmicutes bacterium]|nr:hypothetical protein [Bacillota bacterium]